LTSSPVFFRIGQVDDAIIVPLLLMIALHMIPPNVLAECQRKVSETREA
jgi:uncharacterized membrane protein YkvA (DUF1232 family)